MKYLYTSQIVPSKGMSYTMYEIEGEDKIIRMLTHIPDAGEIHTYARPPVKKLYKPELCRETDAENFQKLWQEGQ